MTSEEPRPDSAALPAPVTGVARGSEGTGTALDDTQLYDAAELAAAPSAPYAPEPAPAAALEPVQAPAPSSAPVVAPVPRPAPRVAARGRESTRGNPRVGAPVAGFVGFALAAGLAILIGASLGSGAVPGGGGVPGGAVNAEQTLGIGSFPDAAPTEATDEEGGSVENGKPGKGCKGKGRGNCNND